MTSGSISVRAPERPSSRQIAAKDVAAVRAAHQRMQKAAGDLDRHERRGRTLKRNALMARYEFGAALVKIETKYGEATLAELAKELGENDTHLRRCRSIAATWVKKRFSVLVSKGMGWTQAFTLASIIDAEKRRELEPHAHESKAKLLGRMERLIDGEDPDVTEDDSDTEARRRRALVSRVDEFKVNGLALVEGLKSETTLLRDLAAAAEAVLLAIPSQCRSSAPRRKTGRG